MNDKVENNRNKVHPKAKESKVVEGLLQRINSPADLKKLPMNELPKLASEIRSVLLKTISKNGGHLSPNLGTVELTIALHRVFDSPKDKILFDTGHQCYTHKLLTGRYDRFHTLRQPGGLSGFTDPRESEHDHFITGHASPVICQAIGMAMARDAKKEDYEIVAVIGDGALTGGVALEGLNYGGYIGKKFILVLNDNQMSYEKTVGGLQAYNNRLSFGNRIFESPIYHQVRGDIHLLMDNVPRDREELHAAVRRLREAALSVLTPGIVFEELGYRYLGPIDGHNIPLLIETFQKAKLMKGPVLVHVLTTKGKGVPFAESSSDKHGKYHGLGKFDPESGEIIKNPGSLPLYFEVFGNKLIELARRDKRIYALTAAMPIGSGLLPFSKEFPDRFIDVGIAEQSEVTIASGLAKGGMKPVVAVHSSFLKRAIDEVIYEVALQNLPVVFALNNSGLVDDNATQQGPFDIVYMRMIPNMVAMAPANEHELEEMLEFALSWDKGPSSIRYPKASITGMPKPNDLKIELGKGKIEVEYGEDIAIIAIGSMVNEAIKAAEILKSKGINATVVNARFIKPIDEKLIVDVASRCGRVVTVEEGQALGGFGSGVLEVLAHNNLQIPVKVLAIPDRFF
ncbi:MAG: 1-deoxy-D-xylulose-5-phosphate synthase, partial [Candidatus Micrarchaeota archaeon]|nr:1-deoxy-D-xylulose-5-phosphate synthase [Candidatus Micrarchaeota archaeon]